MELVEAQGGKAYNGAKMLLYQGIIAFELWTGCEVESWLADKVYERMQEAKRQRTENKMKHKRRNIVLIGFMGSGKTTLGLKLSYLLRMPVEDTDKMIERQEGRSISKILRMMGKPISGNWRRKSYANAAAENTSTFCP